MQIFSRARAKPASLAEPAKPAPPMVPVDRNIGLRDAVIRGWFNAGTGELFTGFPVGPEDIVADIGCGDGGSAGFCARQGARIILADIDANAVARAAARVAAEPNNGGCETHVTGSDPLPIRSDTATRVVCTEVIEHVDSPARLMAELARIGRPGARYLLSCPDPKSEELQKRLAHPSYFEKPNHVRILQPGEFGNYVEDAGLVIEQRSSHGFYWHIWWALFWGTPGVSLENTAHPVLDNWSRTWASLLDQPQGVRIKQALDDLFPKSQIIIARKPAKA